MQDISVIILTLNEERHIARVMQNAQKFARTVYVVDSFSTDRTVELATEMGAVAVRHEFQSHAKQFQWALDNLPITTEWVLRLDADEYLTDKLIDEIERRLPATPSGVNGYTLRCLYNFMGREINHGIIPLVLLRLFRYGKARIEDKLMDEHIYLTEGTTADMSYPFYNASLMTLTEWTAKHNWYATREAIELLTIECQKHSPQQILNIGTHSAGVRAKKLKYACLPLFWRAFALFVYRYFFRLGFLDGKEGFLWHFLQGWWYRTLADAKVYEVKKRCGNDPKAIEEEIKRISISKLKV